MYNTFTSSTSSALIAIHTSNAVPGVTVSSDAVGSATTASPVVILPQIDLKKCRNCHHGHIAGQTGCIDGIGWSVTFIACICEEYVPSGNLEYLEWRYNKKQQKDFL